jgi:uncharacterized protein (TIGR03437 family)
LIAQLRKVGTFDAAGANEVRANAAAPLGVDGFNPAPLLSLFAFPQTFLHNGALTSLDAVLENVTHRTAGGGTDVLVDTNARARLVKFLLSIDAGTQPVIPNTPGTASTVPADTYTPGAPLAVEGIVSAFGSGFAAGPNSASTIPLPTFLGGTTLAVLDSAGKQRLAPLFYVGPGQVNYQVPAGTAIGQATITVTSNSGAVSKGTVTIAAVAPGLFTANADGKGVPAATALRGAADGTLTPVAVYQCDNAGKNCVPVPIDLGAASDIVVITLYGSGFRNKTTGVQVTIGGGDAPVLFSGAQGTFQGLDQVNAQIPSSLRGRGEVNLVLTADGKTSNTVTINVK